MPRSSSGPRSLRLYLDDIHEAIEDIYLFTRGKEFDDEHDRLLQAGVERKFTIIGEAMSQMAHHYPSSKQRIEAAREIVDFRNLIIHEYNQIDDVVVWSIIQDSLPSFEAEIAQWLREVEKP